MTGEAFHGFDFLFGTSCHAINLRIHSSDVKNVKTTTFTQESCEGAVSVSRPLHSEPLPDWRELDEMEIFELSYDNYYVTLSFGIERGEESKGAGIIREEDHALRVVESLGWMHIITVMANPQECQRNIRKIAAEKHIAPPGYEETIYLTKGADGRWMATAMYSEGQIAENLSRFCTWINSKRQDLLPTLQKPPVKKIFGITLHR